MFVDGFIYGSMVTLIVVQIYAAFAELRKETPPKTRGDKCQR